MFIDKVCVLHWRSNTTYFANEVHILFLPIMPVNKKPVKQFTIYLTGLSPSLYFNYSAASSTLSAESAGASTNSVIPLFTKILYHEISFLISPL